MLTDRRVDTSLDVLLAESEAQRVRGAYREGRGLAEEAARVASAQGDDLSLALALRLVTNQAIRLGDNEDAARSGNQAVAVAERAGSVPYRVDALNLLALAYLNLGLYDESLDAIERSVALLVHVDDLELRCGTYNRAGTVRAAMGEFAAAEQLFERAQRELGQAGPDASSETQFCLFTNMADLVLERTRAVGDVDEQDVRLALTRAETALALANESGNPYRTALSLLNSGCLASYLGEQERAQRCLDGSMQLARDHGYRSLEMSVLEGRALEAQLHERHEEAVELWKEVIALAEELSEGANLARAHHLVSQVYEQLGRFGEALQSYRRFHDLESTQRTETAEVRSRLVGMTVELAQLRTRAAELDRHAHTDALTGLDNRRAFDATLPRLLAAAAPQDWLTLCLLDVDHFKRVNDTFGHATGDEVLRVLGRLLLGDARRGDHVARVGGEELALVCCIPRPDPATDLAAALQARVDRLRLAVQDHPWGEVAEGLAVTVSLGAVLVRCGDRPVAADLLDQADRLLYDAKHAGRNRARTRVVSPR